MKWKCNLLELLQAKKMKQKELAAAIGATEVSMSRYVNEDRIPKATTAILIAKVLECRVEDLFTVKE